MNKPARLFLLWLALAALPLSLRADEPVIVTGAKITECGIYQAKVMSTETNADNLKTLGLADFTLVQSTTNIPARLGVCFGFRYEIFGTPTNAPVTLTMVGKHPPLKNPITGAISTIDRYPTPAWIGKTYTAFTLDEPGDLAPGLWTFEVWHEGKKLCTQSFLLLPDETKSKP